MYSTLEPRATPTTSLSIAEGVMDVNAAETARIPNRIVLVKRIVNVVNRIAVVSVGFILGLITLMPNLMMSDSGTSIAITATYVGVVASGCMVVGGIVGAVRGTPWAGWFWLLPGVGIEILLFATLAIFWR